MDVAGYLLAQVVAELSTVFDNIEVITTVGNHGRLAKRKEYKFSVCWKTLTTLPTKFALWHLENTEM